MMFFRQNTDLHLKEESLRDVEKLERIIEEKGEWDYEKSRALSILVNKQFILDHNNPLVQRFSTFYLIVYNLIKNFREKRKWDHKNAQCCLETKRSLNKLAFATL